MRTSNSRARTRSTIGVLSLLGTVLAVSCSLPGCSSGEPVTPEALSRAREVWSKAGLRDYELEWTSSGSTSAHYAVTVRGGTVQKLQSVAPDGRHFDLHPAEPRFFGVDGLFTTIADELAQLKTPTPFGQPAGTKVAMRFTTDPALGYPRSYRRDVFGTTQSLRIDVIRLTPSGTKGTSKNGADL